jgi:hypothetical protein
MKSKTEIVIDSFNICIEHMDAIGLITKDMLKIAVADLKRLAEYDKHIEDGTIISLNNIPEDAKIKVRETVQRIENEGSGGLICILL